MDDLRLALDNLRTSGLGDHPLTAALEALCADARQRCSLAVDCQLAAGADALPPLVAEVLWRVAQEGLTNVGRHAQARRVQLNLTLLPREIVLRVADDGVGLPPGAEDKPGHYGLRGLRERVEGLGGTFTLAIPEGGGTLIEARLPIIADETHPHPAGRRPDPHAAGVKTILDLEPGFRVAGEAENGQTAV